MSGRITKEMRIRRREDYLIVQSQGKKLHGRHLLAFVRKHDAESCAGRLGLTVTKRLGNAVVRNRIKRMLRESMRLRGWVPRGWDVVLVAKESAARQGHPDDFDSDLVRVLQQLS